MKKFKNFIKRFIDLFFLKKNNINYFIITSLSSHTPSAAGSDLTKARIVIKSILNIHRSCHNLYSRLYENSVKKYESVDDYVSTFARMYSLNKDKILQEGIKLKNLFLDLGSDKSFPHNYENIYSSVFLQSSEHTSLLEIGIGTNDLTYVSNMGKHGFPGASLFAFEKYLNIDIYGADIDKKILINDKLIKCFYVDQLNPKSLDSLSKKLPNDISFIIDDGLHNPYSILNTFILAFQNLKKGGWYLIEDISEDSADILESYLLPIADKFEIHIVNTLDNVKFFALRKIV